MVANECRDEQGAGRSGEKNWSEGRSDRDLAGKYAEFSDDWVRDFLVARESEVAEVVHVQYLVTFRKYLPFLGAAVTEATHRPLHPAPH